MKIAYLHYHLKTGGVTTVLKQQLTTLARQTEQLVITGHPPTTPLDADTIHIPELGYSNDYNGNIEPFSAARKILMSSFFPIRLPHDSWNWLPQTRMR